MMTRNAETAETVQTVDILVFMCFFSLSSLFLECLPARKEWNSFVKASSLKFPAKTCWRQSRRQGGRQSGRQAGRQSRNKVSGIVGGSGTQAGRQSRNKVSDIVGGFWKTRRSTKWRQAMLETKGEKAGDNVSDELGDSQRRCQGIVAQPLHHCELPGCPYFMGFTGLEGYHPSVVRIAWPHPAHPPRIQAWSSKLSTVPCTWLTRCANYCKPDCNNLGKPFCYYWLIHLHTTQAHMFLSISVPALAQFVKLSNEVMQHPQQGLDSNQLRWSKDGPANEKHAYSWNCSRSFFNPSFCLLQRYQRWCKAKMIRLEAWENAK